MAPRRSLAGNFLAVLFGQLGTWSLTVLTLTLLPRYLGPAGMGDISVGGTVAALSAVVAGMGIGTLVTREIARGADESGSLAGTAVAVSFTLGGGVGAIAFMGARFAGYEGDTLVAVAWSCVGVPFIVSSAVAIAILQGKERMKAAALVDVVSKALLLAVVIGVVALDLGLAAYLAGSLAVLVLTFTTLMALLRRYHRPRFAGFSQSGVRALVGGSVAFFAINVIWAVYTSLDPLLLSWLANREAVGIYAAPMRIFGTLMFIPVALTTVVFPRLAALHGSGSDGGEFGAFSGDILRMSLVTSALVSVGAVGFSDELLVRILGDEFARSGPVIVVMALSLLPTSMSMVCVRVAYASDRQRQVSAIGAASLVIRVGLAVMLIPVFDARWSNPALGGAVSLLAVECAMTLALSRLLPSSVATPGLWRFAARTLLSMLAALGLLAVLAPWTGSLVASGLAGLGFLALCAMLGVITPREAPRSLRARQPGLLLGAD